MKKACLLTLLLFLLPGTVLASGQSNQYYPPSDSDYFMKKFSWQLYMSSGVKQVIFKQYDEKFKKRMTLYHDVKKANSFLWVDFYCRGQVSVEFLDKKGKVMDSFIRDSAKKYLDNSSCTYRYAVTFSDFDEKKRKYKSDKFKKNRKK